MIHVPPFQPGSKLTPETLRVWADAIRELQRCAITDVRGPLIRFANSLMLGSLPPDADTVLVKNNTGADVAKFAILGIGYGGVVTTPTADLVAFKSAPIFIGDTPTTANHAGRFVICMEDIANGKIGHGLASGVYVCQVAVGAAGDGYADITNGSTVKLTSGGSGAAQILYKEAGTGDKWCVVRLSNPAGRGGVFPVILNKTSGDDGTATTTAQYVYTVFDLDGTTVLGTNIAPSKPRPYGKTTAPINGSYGLAFFHGTVLHLWDAGEVPTKLACTS